MSAISRPSNKFQEVLVNGKKVLWNRTTQPHPNTVGNNNSRVGFKYNCYFHPLGWLFQITVKHAIIGVIEMAHGPKGILKYDPQAYVYDDSRLKSLNEELNRLIDKHFPDTTTEQVAAMRERDPHCIFPAGKTIDQQRTRTLYRQVKDIMLFLMKEDIYYRPRDLSLLVDLAEFIVANKELFSQRTAEEQENVARFG